MVERYLQLAGVGICKTGRWLWLLITGVNKARARGWRGGQVGAEGGAGGGGGKAACGPQVARAVFAGFVRDSSVGSRPKSQGQPC